VSLTSQYKCEFGKINTFFQTGGALLGKSNYCPLEAESWDITLSGPFDKRVELREIGDSFKKLRGR
jgi:hypothetical protein